MHIVIAMLVGQQEDRPLSITYNIAVQNLGLFYRFDRQHKVHGDDDDDDPTSFQQWVPDEELPPLVVIVANNDESGEQKEKPKISGYRIVDLGYVAEQYILMASHPTTCTYGKFELVREVKCGLTSVLVHQCKVCEREFRVPTERPGRTGTINDSAVWGSLSIGIGYSQLEELLGVMDIHIIIYILYILYKYIIIYL